MLTASDFLPYIDRWLRHKGKGKPMITDVKINEEQKKKYYERG